MSPSKEKSTRGQMNSMDELRKRPGAHSPPPVFGMLTLESFSCLNARWNWHMVNAPKGEHLT
jgi:hypothetical protein